MQFSVNISIVRFMRFVMLDQTPQNTEAVMAVLREAISEFHMPIKQIAIRTGISVSAVQNIASGKTAWPRPGTFGALCHILRLELSLRKIGK